MAGLDPARRQATIAWIADDPSPTDRQELQGVLAAAMAVSADAVAELDVRMDGRLAFGTAGLRGPLRAGPTGMNLAVVRRAAAGIAAFLQGSGDAGALVVVGYDRRHRSQEFAADAAAVLAAAGFDVRLAPDALPTPLTAFATRRLSAAAGLMVTASHNPPQDNGLKVYLRGGVQLVGPADEQIEAAIAAVRSIHAVATAPERVGTWPRDVVPAYLERAASVPGGPVGSARPAGALRIALTPMHGVGGETAVRALAAAGFSDVVVVREQAVPDPDFPTVEFPNPEEPGAADRLLALAEATAADLAVALDPDADRCALGARFPDGWRMLRGDETGVLLGDFVLQHLDRGRVADPLVATTIVSSEQLRRVAEHHGAREDETLTGFKWIVRAGDGAGTGLVFGYEEALGVCVDPDVVRDKDGITALAASLRAAGSDLPTRLDELAARDGVFVTDQLSVRVTDLALIEQAMARVRSAPPATLLGEPVELTDLLPRTDAVRLRTRTARVVLRPSGTEPKLKAYLQLSGPPGAPADVAAGRAELTGRLPELRGEVAAALGRST
jgi:phosphomannomutase